MAYSVRLTGFSKSDGSELLNIEPNWWSVGDIKKYLTCNWKVSNDTGSYRDEDTDISAEQARMLHMQFAPIALDRIAYNEDCVRSERLKSDDNAAVRLAMYVKYVAELKAEFDSIESAVDADSDLFSHFHVCIFEWESGY
jgi:hypothetical protein